MSEQDQGQFERARQRYLQSKARATTWRGRAAAWFDRVVRALWSRLNLPAAAMAVLLAGFVIGLALPTRAHGAEFGPWQVAEVTAYCPCSICCGSFADGRTANNTRVDRVPYNFASDRSLPFGSQIYVPIDFGVLDNVRRDERVFVVDDRGGALDSEARERGVLRLDLRVRDHWWAVRFGRRYIPVRICMSD